MACFTATGPKTCQCYSHEVELLINKQENPLRPLKAHSTASRASRGALHEFHQTLTRADSFVCLLATLHRGDSMGIHAFQTRIILAYRSLMFLASSI